MGVVVMKITEEQSVEKSESDIEVSEPPIGTYAFTARMMAGPNPTDEEAEFWDMWKEDMKEWA
jgi:hypothetical protein